MQQNADEILIADPDRPELNIPAETIRMIGIDILSYFHDRDFFGITTENAFHRTRNSPELKAKVISLLTESAGYVESVIRNTLTQEYINKIHDADTRLVCGFTIKKRNEYSVDDVECTLAVGRNDEAGYGISTIYFSMDNAPFFYTYQSIMYGRSAYPEVGQAVLTLTADRLPGEAIHATFAKEEDMVVYRLSGSTPNFNMIH